ncbi:MAG: hypothetical protein ACI8RD_010647, partial [Bacillariaceae sp.]|jgi:hypothetical protein
VSGSDILDFHYKGREIFDSLEIIRMRYSMPYASDYQSAEIRKTETGCNDDDFGIVVSNMNL